MISKLLRPALLMIIFTLGSFVLGYAEAPVQKTIAHDFWQPLPVLRQDEPSTGSTIEQIQAYENNSTYNIYKYRTYERGYGIRVKDINQDGWDDVIFITGSYSLRIWLQNPECHQLQEWKTYILDILPFDLEIVDLNNDGEMEIIIIGMRYFDFINEIGFVQIINPFQDEYSPSDNLVEIGIGPRKLEIGDINDDTRPDILVTSRNVLDVLVQQEDGTFILHPVDSPYVPSNEVPNDLAVGDFNNDSLIDVAVQVSNRTDNIILYYQSSGFLLPGISYTGPFGSGMTSGDITGDGKSDLVMIHTYNSPNAKVVVFAQKAGGVFDAGTAYQTYDTPVSPNLADMDGDGRLDLVLINTGYGSFTTHYQNADGKLSEGIITPAGDAQQVYPYQNFASVGDVTGDDKLDVVFLGINDGLVIDAQGPAPACPESLPTRAPVPYMLYGILPSMDGDEVVSGDVNGDGLEDFIVLGINSSITQIILQIPGGEFEVGPTVPLNNPNEELDLDGLSVGDLNGDGRLDISAANYQDWGGLFIAYQDLDGGFLPPVTLLDAPYPIQTHIADWNGDGRDDLLAITNNGINMYKQTGDGLLADLVVYAGGEIGNTILSKVADWNSDGRLDLIACWRHWPYDRQVRVYLQEEDGSFNLLPEQRFENVSGLAVGDINSDNKTDIVISNFQNIPEARLGLFYQKPNGMISDRTILSDWNYSGPGAISVDDLNFDGLNDILVMNHGGFPFSIFTQNGNHTFDPVLYADLRIWNGRTPHSIARVDTNADDIADVFLVVTGDEYLLFLKILHPDERIIFGTFLPFVYISTALN